MDINAPDRTVSLSVGEFSDFSVYPRPRISTGNGAWRAQAGQQWHSAIQKQSEARGENMKSESPIEGNVLWKGWEFKLNGRIDQIKLSPAENRIREIKTVSTKLPIPKEEIISQYKHYCLQLLCYHQLIRNGGIDAKAEIELELLFVEIDSGITQSYLISDDDTHLWAKHLDAFRDFLESKRERLTRLQDLKFKKAYETPRIGQETIVDDLRKAFGRTNVVCLEAPTGYGKTGIAWEAALSKLSNGEADRIIYLTSKSTGQIETTRRLETLLGHNPQATFWQIRNKQEHCVNSEFRCLSSVCPYIRELDTKWEKSGLQRLHLMTREATDLEQVKAESEAAEICPYETMKAALGFRDIWIGDLNYLFSPSSAGLLENQLDFEPSRTFLVIDEAHNLPSRVESNFSFEIEALQLSVASEELRSFGASAKLRHIIDLLSQDILTYHSGDTLSARQIDDFMDSLYEISRVASLEPLPFDEMSPETNDLIWRIARAASDHREFELPLLAWLKQSGVMRIDCLDASKIIGNAIRSFSNALLLSATLSPFETFLESCGLQDLAAPPEKLCPPAPWLENAYDMAIDTRVDTRYRKRESFFPKTAHTIADLVEKHAPIAVFFPSYAYAKKIADELDKEHPFYRIAIQESGGSLTEQEAFIEEALRFSEAIFLIMGSSFSEGVDLIGGRVKAAMVVSPSLPEVNVVRNAKKDLFESASKDGFERAYLHPGMQKVNQALGRLVRAPGQKVKALLHCQRFAERKTKELLSSQYQEAKLILSEKDFEDWLND